MIRLLLPLLLAATPGAAFELNVPGEITLREVDPLAVHALATGPAVFGQVPTVAVEGPVTRLVWRLGDVPSNLALFNELRAAIETEGFEPGYSCETRACGGFDFRFGIEVMPAPQMFMDLNAFHYLAARRDAEALSLIVSGAGARAYVQLVLVGGTSAVDSLAPPVTSPRAAAPVTLAQTLETFGKVTLEGVEFSTGNSEITSGVSPTLSALARYLADHPSRSLALVGHTDAEGSLEGNLALSQRRAEAVRAVMIDRLGVNPSQVEAKGVGFLVPRASNLTQEGRAKNRRVEAVLTSTR